MSWQPIETAPKNPRQRILLFDDRYAMTLGSIFIGKWYRHESGGGWTTNSIDCADYEFEPTHWHPLPEPPAL